MKKPLFLIVVLTMALSAVAQREGDEAFDALMGGAYIYSTIATNVPYQWSYHDVRYETTYYADPITPNRYDCRITGVSKSPFERAVVVPKVIGLGVYRLHPTAMEVGCFQQTGIRSIDFRADIRTIPQNAFLFCSDLQSVEFPNDSPHFIEAAAFKGCQKLDGIRFPARLRYIGNYAFEGCLSLSEIYIPKDVAYLGEYAFNDCISLRKVEFATGHFRQIPERCFCNCEKLEHIEIPEGVDVLGPNSFYFSGLKSIVLPATMRTLCDGSLSNTPLADIYCRALTPPQMGRIWTVDQLRAIRLHVPAAAINAYRNHPHWSYAASIEPF